ncbi:MAG: Gfo/Idh/MocA family oxidoreductase [Clostridiales bacterium]|nr:Gfo/Idh/MocA family oxidoreductase [Clostridiales bacterium]
MESRPVRVGVVGYGYWGPNLVRNLDRLPDAELCAVCDASPAHRSRLRDAHPGVLGVADLDEMLATCGLEAVVIATPAPTHASVATRVLEAGLHCYVEKPLTLSSADAEALVELAAARDRVLMAGHLMIYHGAIEWIRDYLASGDLGDVLYVYSQRLNLGKVRADENSFWSLAPHDISVVLDLLGEAPSSVSASGAAYLRDGIEDVVFATLRFPSGKMANIHVSWLDPHKVRRLTVVGTKKMLVFDDMEATEKIWIYDKGVAPTGALAYGEDLTLRFGDIIAPYVKMSEPLAAEMTHFLECCRTGSRPRSDGASGLEVVRVLEAADTSIAGGGMPVTIERTSS